MKLKLLFPLLSILLYSCKANQKPANISRVLKYTSRGAIHVDTLIVMDTLFGNGYNVAYNGFGDTDKVVFFDRWENDSTQVYDYECLHLPDTISPEILQSVKHNTKHRQFLLYTEILKPAYRKIIRNQEAYIKDSLFKTARKQFEEKGILY